MGDNDFERRLRRARIAAFVQELRWKNWLGIAAAITVLIAIVLLFHAKYGPLTFLRHATGHELSSFVTPQRITRSTFYLNVELDNGSKALVTLPPGIDHQPEKRMKLSIYEGGFWLTRHEVVEFEGYIDPTSDKR